MREAPIQQRILLAVSQGLTRLFRVNTGVAWAGKGAPQQFSRPQIVKVQPGDVLLHAAQPIRMGLTNGGSDTIGWTTIVITPEMVGRKIAAFTAIEVKGEGGKPKDDQLHFIEQVQDAGGIAGVAYSVEEAKAIIDNYRSSGG